jgi:hypothetical protein
MPWPFTTTTKDQEPTTRLPSQEDTLIQPPDGPTNGWEVPEEPTATFLAPDAPAEGVLVGQGILGESVSALEPEPPTQVDNLDTWLERMKEAQRALTTAPPEPEPLVPEVPPTPATVVLDERALWSEVDQAMRDGDGARLRELVGATEQDPLEEHTVWSDPIAEAPTENSVSAYLDAGSMDPRESEARLRGFIDTLKVRLERLESRVTLLEDELADAEDAKVDGDLDPILRTQILESFEALHEKLELLPNNPFKAMALGAWIQTLQFATSSLDHDIVSQGLSSKS